MFQHFEKIHKKIFKKNALNSNVIISNNCDFNINNDVVNYNKCTSTHTYTSLLSNSENIISNNIGSNIPSNLTTTNTTNTTNNTNNTIPGIISSENANIKTINSDIVETQIKSISTDQINNQINNKLDNTINSFVENTNNYNNVINDNNNNINSTNIANIKINSSDNDKDVNDIVNKDTDNKEDISDMVVDQLDRQIDDNISEHTIANVATIDKTYEDSICKSIILFIDISNSLIMLSLIFYDYYTNYNNIIHVFIFDLLLIKWLILLKIKT